MFGNGRTGVPAVSSTKMLVAYVLLVLLVGRPFKGILADPESKSPSARECRQHVEKALNQYFDSKDTSTSSTRDQDTSKSSDTLTPQTQQHGEDDGDDDDDDDNDPPLTHVIDEKDGYDNDDECDDSTDNSDATDNKVEEDEDDDEDDDEEENEGDDDEDDADDDEVKQDDDITDDEDDSQEEEEDDDEDSIDNKSEESPQNKSDIKKEQEETNKGSYTSSSEMEKTSSTTTEDEADDDEEEEEDNDNDDDDDEEEEVANIPGAVVKESEKTESYKATGTPDRVISRMAQEFLKSQSAAQQSKDAAKMAQKAAASLKEQLPTIKSPSFHKKDAVDDSDDDGIENIYEDDEDEEPITGTRSRDHIDVVLGFDEIGTDYDHKENKFAQSLYNDIKKIHATSIKPMESLFKFTDSTTRLLGDAEIFGKPMVLFVGPWSTGKSTIINYLLGTERTPSALKTGTGITDVDFTVITYGDKRQTVSGTELAADWQYSSLQKFGQGFLDHFKAIKMPHTLLKRINIVDTPGILESRKNTERGYSFNDAFQWFIDRADAIYVVLDPTKVDIGAELGAVLDQLKGREVRFILNKADTIRRTDLMKVVGQLFWNLSPLMSGAEAPVIYAVSLSTRPFNPSAPSKFLKDQENNFLYDLKSTMDKRVENRILYARRHAVRVRNHAKMIDCYLATFYKHKSIFSSKKNVAKLITENPMDYHIYEGLSSMSNVSRYDLPDPITYKQFFKLHPLYEFKPLASTCSYFRGCPMDKLDNAIANELPELFARYKKATSPSATPEVASPTTKPGGR